MTPNYPPVLFLEVELSLLLLAAFLKTAETLTLVGNSCLWGTQACEALMLVGHSCLWGTHACGALMLVAVTNA